MLDDFPEAQKRSTFNRRLSVPIQSVTKSKPETMMQAQQIHSPSRPAPSRHNSLDQARLNRQHRRSQCDRACNEHKKSEPESRSSAHSNGSRSSSSRSSAGDSAFSNSQMTLELDSCEQNLNCFVRSIKGERLAPSTPASDQSSAVEEVSSRDQFKISWRNLTYTVPEKRFSSLRLRLSKCCDKIWPPNEPEVLDDLPAAGSFGDDEAPLRRPVIGKMRQEIFSDLHGCIRSGQLTAILGPSGAGKTTLLKCLTNNIERGLVGSIEISGGPLTSSQKQIKLCSIPQKDYLFDNLTVMENLIFASRIKNIQPNFDHVHNTERVANLLGLQACLKLKTSKLSGGQHKRVSIAQELLSKPDILVLDEPTSGLDSLTCFRTVSVLRELVNLSRAGMMPPLAIVMTIHQPQVKIFNLFQHVYVMSAMGQCVYEGKPGDLVNTVAETCKLLPPADDLNPASFIINLASEVYGERPIKQLVRLQRENFLQIHGDQLSGSQQVRHKKFQDLGEFKVFVDPSINKLPSIITQTQAYASTISHNNTNGSVNFLQESNDCLKEAHLVLPNSYRYSETAVEQSLEDLHHNDGLRISNRLRRRNNEHYKCFWLHTSLLVKRLWLSMWRDSLLTKTRVIFHVVIPFVFYFVYSQKSGSANACPYVERDIDIRSMTSSDEVQRLEDQHNELILSFENVSLFFLLLYSFSMCVLAVTALSFPLNMQILLKETNNGWYSMPRFVMAKTLADLPLELTMPMISVAIAYVLTGQPSSYLCWRMLTVTAVMTLCSLISQTQGLLFGAYFMNNIQAAVFVSQASSIPWIMLSGFTTRVSELPTLLQWLSFGSIYRLGIESIVSVRYGFGMCPCDHEVINANTKARIVGIPDQLRSVLQYYMDMSTEVSTQAQVNNSISQAVNASVPANSIPSISSLVASTSAVAAATTTTATEFDSSPTEDIFDRLASILSRANTYGVNVVSCHDVRPFIMSAREVDERTLPTFLLILVAIFVSLKLLLFWVVRIRSR